MSNPIFKALGGGQPQGLMGALQQFKANPMQMLMQRRFNVPQSMMQDPQAMVQHLVSSGQISQEQVNRAFQMAQGMRR